MPAVLPAPEEEKDVKTAIGAARAKNARDEMTSCVSVKLGTIVIDCGDPESLAAFWCDVLEWRVVDRDDDGAVEIGGRDQADVTMLFEPVQEPEQVKNRVHIDLNPSARQTRQPSSIAWSASARGPSMSGSATRRGSSSPIPKATSSVCSAPHVDVCPSPSSWPIVRRAPPRYSFLQ